jgi:hypothetical protein
MKLHITLATLATMTFASAAFAAPAASTTASSTSSMSSDPNIATPGTKGIGFSFPNGGGATINGQYFLDKNHALRAAVGFELSKADPADVVFGFSVDAGYRIYCHKISSVAVFAQPSLFIARNAASGAPVTIGPSGAVGAEYFFNSNLAFGVHTGVNLTFTDSFKSFKFNTGTTAITGTLYW